MVAGDFMWLFILEGISKLAKSNCCFAAFPLYLMDGLLWVFYVDS